MKEYAADTIKRLQRERDDAVVHAEALTAELAIMRAHRLRLLRVLNAVRESIALSVEMSGGDPDPLDPPQRR